MDRMYIYERKRTDLFLALAPAVIGYTAVLFPLSVLGVVLFIGVAGLVGLLALVYAWWRLLRPNPSISTLQAMRIGLSVGLAASVVISIGTFVGTIHEFAMGAAMLFLPFTGVGVLAAWFIGVSFPGRAVETRASRWIAFALAALLGVQAVVWACFIYGVTLIH